MSKWYEEAVFYHMYPIGMTGAPLRNENQGIVHNFRKLEQWLPHLKNIKATAIYMGPPFESVSHGYDTTDYKKIDQRLGDNADFAHFVSEAHKLGIRVVVDGVFNHTGREFFAFKDIQEKREGSPYCNWYKGINFGWNNPYNDGFSYEAWRNCFELVNLNLRNPEVKEYLLGVIDFWISEFDIDGIRLDCADCLDFDFMEEMRRRTEAMKEDFWLMGEVIHGDYARYIQDGSKMLHSVTNYELHKGLYSGHNDHNYFEIAHTIRREFDENGGIYKGMKLYTFVDNHDVDRIMSKINRKEHIFPIYTLLYTLPGIPSIYYGSEWGIEGSKNNGGDPALRPAVDIEKALEEHRDSRILAWVRTLGELHEKFKNCLAYGRYRELYLTNRQFAFLRFTEEEGLITAVNNDEQAARISIPAPDAGRRYRNCVTGEEVPVENGKLNITVEAADSVLLEMLYGEGN